MFHTLLRLPISLPIATVRCIALVVVVFVARNTCCFSSITTVHNSFANNSLEYKNTTLNGHPTLSHPLQLLPVFYSFFLYTQQLISCVVCQVINF